MARTARNHTAFVTVRSEGGLLPPDLLARIAGNDAGLHGLTPGDYGLPAGDRVNEAAARAWANVKTYWAAYQAALGTLRPDESGVTETREQWLLPLFRELGYGRLAFRQSAVELDGRRYAISHQAGDGDGAPPVHTISSRLGIDRPPPAREAGDDGRLRMSPHGMLQEYLNRTDSLWGVVSNGLRLRLLRDNQSLSRAAFVEFDLEAMMDDGVYADFVLLFLLLHRSRLPEADGGPPASCWLERWRGAAEEQGARALDELRTGVETAIRAIGRGLLQHPANDALRRKLMDGDLSVQDYYRQLLRLVYRFLFLFAAEERDLLFGPDADPRRRQVYARHYGVTRLRDLVERRRHADRYDDLWRSLLITFEALRDEAVGARLGLKPPAGGLFDEASCPAIEGPRAGTDQALLGNAPLLEAVRGLAFARTGNLVRRVNYRDMDVEELGSVYEGLLELQPRLKTAGERPVFELGASGERKSTGSYYTNPGLVQELIRSALDPVIAAALARGATVAEKRQNLLALKVCDPASGSGHFLLAAARRIGREVARLEAGDTEPSPEAAREATREVIRRCLFAVDKNPLAVDLCKVALWLEGHSPELPLTFLDHHVKCGDSLVGVFDLDVLEAGIPDQAYQPVTGDDKQTAAHLRKVNKAHRAGQLSLEPAPHAELPRAVAADFAAFAGMEERSAGDVRAKEELYDALRARGTAWDTLKTACDLWTAAFFAPLRPGAGWSTDLVPTTATVHRALRRPAALHAQLVGHAQADAQRLRFFHWPLEFPEVFAAGGFDCVLGNPPWERVKLQEQEFFAARDPEIATARNAAERKRLIAALPEKDSALYAAFVQEKRDSEAASLFLRESARFPLTGRGDVNTYSVFAELMAKLAGVDGRAGLIVPTGIATDDTNKHFFRWLVERGRLVSLFDFENREGVFPGVHRSYKFSLLTVTGAERRAAPFEVAFFLLEPAALRDPERRFPLSADDIALLNPNTKTCPIFRTARDAAITTALYRAAPVLIREGPPEDNPWGVTFKTLFHMSNDSGLFRTRAQLEQQGATLGADGRFRRGGDVWLPLYEAKMIHQFDHRFATYETAAAGPAAAKARDLTLAEHQDPTRVALPRYWVAEREVERAAGAPRPAHPGWFLGFRDIARNTDERTAIFSLVPWAAVNHKTPLIVSRCSAQENAALLANFNSLVLDYAARQKVGGTSLGFFILKQFPVLPPETYTPDLLTEIVSRVLELVYTAHDLTPFARDCGYDGPPFAWDVARRAHLRAELDGIYAHLYGLNRADFAYILDQFPIVRRIDEKTFGCYRTKTLCLAAYDQRPP